MANQTPSGVVCDELPGHLADRLVLVSAGYAAGSADLGWAATGLACSPRTSVAMVLRLASVRNSPGLWQEKRMLVIVVALAGSAWTLFPRTRWLLWRLEAEG